MKTIAYATRAAAALDRHKNVAESIEAAIEAYAVDPQTQRANVKQLKGVDALRLRVGSFRVLFTEDVATITILDIGPRGGIYR
ncbi:MAG: type II toxin-antitoxin system RelE/ParE family toxin [Hyphomicrobiales bacterium]